MNLPPDEYRIKEPVKTATDLPELVREHGVELRLEGRSLVGLCPFHDEKTPSFKVDSEKQLYKCFGCDAGGDVFTFIQQIDGIDFRTSLSKLATRAGIDVANHNSGRSEYPGRSTATKILEGPRRVVASFDYLNRMGDWCYAVDRIEGGGKPKAFKMRPAGISKQDRILYRLPGLSDGDDPVVIPEGEGKADVLVARGYTAIACPFGAGAWLTHYADSLRRRGCVIWPDKDAAGMRFAKAVARSLDGVAASVRIVTPPDFLPEGATLSIS